MRALNVIRGFHYSLIPLALLLGGLAMPGCAPQPTEPRAVRGFIVTTVRVTSTPAGKSNPSTENSTVTREVFLPNIGVTLTNADGDEFGPLPTDLSGRFAFNRVAPGDYRLCWKAPGYISDCRKEPVKVGNKILHLGTIQIQVERKANFGSLYGEVRLMDGSIPRTYDILANINAFPLVTVLDKDVALGQAPANNQGQYLLPQVPAQQFLKVRTQVDQANFERSLGPTVLGSGRTYRLDIRLPNRRPALLPLIARNAAAQRVRSPRPGDEVNLSAEPAPSQKEPLKYRWRLAPGAGTLSSTSDPSVTWKLPSAPGEHQVELIAYDNLGGYRKTNLVLNTDVNGEGIVFSGKVMGADVPHLAGASVTVAGKSTTTDAAGHFTLRVKEMERYILHISHPDYAFFSRIYDDSQRGGRWTLYPARTIKDQDPKQAIELTDQTSQERCWGNPSSRFDWKATPLRDRIQFQDGTGKVVEGKLPREDRLALAAARQPRQCSPGIRVRIPANGLVDENQNPPSGLVDIKLSTIDIYAADAMPGDWSALDLNRDLRVMQSYGAGTIEISDSLGHSFNLAAGVEAEVIIPVDPLQLAFPAAIPPTIPYLTYDETNGIWVQDGEATLDAGGQFYLAKAKHFSAENMDVTKVDQSCVKLDASALPGTFKKVEVIVPDPGGAAPRIITRNIDNTGVGDAKIHALYNLPSNEDIYVIPIRVDDGGIEPDQPFGQFSVNTGDPQVPTDPNKPKFECAPGDGCVGTNPYGACRVSIALSDLGAPPDPADVFLAGLQYNPAAASFLAELQPDLVAAGPDGTDFSDAILNATQAYYETIDPHNHRRTLDDFKAHNGYPGGGESHALYANSGDLGFGRDMHCWKNACDADDPTICDTVCYVTNYLDGDAFDSDDQEDFKRTVDAENASGTDANAVATVAMEHSFLDDPDSDGAFIGTSRAVKFYVYFGDGNGDGVDDSGDPAFPDGALLLNANLDGKGERPVPQLCMVCHGGSLQNNGLDLSAPAFDPTDPTTADLGAVFLPFDLQAFTFVDNYLGSSTWNKATQQQAFKDLNDLISATHPASATGLLALQSKFYEDWVDANPATHSQKADFVVPAWTGDATEEQAYREIVSPSCRACHTAQYDSDLTFESDENFVAQTFVDNAVCGIKVMPHAKATYEQFWLSLNPHQPALLDNFGNTFMAPWTDCSTAPPVVVADLTFDSTIQGMVDGNGCTDAGCHGNAPGADGFHLIYSNLFDFSNHATTTRYIDADGVSSGNPLSSYLYLKISDQQDSVPGGTGSPMPLGSAEGLTPAEQAIISQWIEEGAPEN